MKRTMSFALFSLGVLLAIVMLPAGSAGTAQAQEEVRGAPRLVMPYFIPCSVGSLKGGYGVQVKGNILQAPPALPKSYAAVMLVTFDGLGNYTAKGLANTDGNQTEVMETGTYLVNPDCTGLMRGPVFDYNLVLSKDGNEFDLVYASKAGLMTPIPTVLNGVGKKVAPYEVGRTPLERAVSFTCSLGTIRGAWSTIFEGVAYQGVPLPPGPFRGIGTLEYKPMGEISGIYSGVYGGVYLAFPFTGKMAFVNPDCTAIGYGDNGGPSAFQILVNGGRELVGLGIYPQGVPSPPEGFGVQTVATGKRIR